VGLTAEADCPVELDLVRVANAVVAHSGAERNSTLAA
jgi:hypothetical protein